MVKLQMKGSRKVDVPDISIDKAKRICEFTGLPRTKAFGLMASFVPIIKSGSIRNLKNGKRLVKIIGEKGEWDFEI